MPVFHASRSPEREKDKEPREPLPYGRYQEWVKRLGEETGFVQVLTTYCLRRAAGNAINGKPRRVWPRKRLTDWVRRPQFEWGGAQSGARPRQFDDLSAELSLPHGSLRYASSLSRHRVARGLDRCFPPDEPHDRSSPTSWPFPSTIAALEAGCAYSRAARAPATPLRTDSRQIPLYLPGRGSTDLRWIPAGQAGYRSPAQGERARSEGAIASRLRRDSSDARYARADSSQRPRPLPCSASSGTSRVCLWGTRSYRPSLLRPAAVCETWREPGSADHYRRQLGLAVPPRTASSKAPSIVGG